MKSTSKVRKGLLVSSLFLILSVVSCVPPELERALTLVPNVFYADSFVYKAGSHFSGDAGPPIVHNKRTTVMWGTPNPLCGNALGTNAPISFESEFDSRGPRSEYVNTPACDLMTPPGCDSPSVPITGPSFEGDIVTGVDPGTDADIYQHILHTEIPRDSASAVLRAFDESGQGGNGANKDILGTYVQFNPQMWTMKPWGITTEQFGNHNKLRMAVLSTQRISKVRLPDPANQQLIQTVSIIVINRNCDQQISPTYCQLELQFRTLSVGVNAHTKTSDASYYADPGQGGLSVMYGPINEGSHPTYATNSEGVRKSVWTSWGKHTLDVADDTEYGFHVEMTFNQFKNVVNILSNNDPVRYFGTTWGTPSDWYLLRAGYGQENFNRNTANYKSVIEGLVKDLRVESIAF